jgi:RNA polymerase sigma factor (sigma-70 family)
VDERVEPSEPWIVLPSPEREGGGFPALEPLADATFTAFYREFVPTLVAFLLWQGARLPDAAEIAQETMLQAYRHWVTVRQPQAWARRVASRMYTRRIASIEEFTVSEVPDRAPLLPSQTGLEAWEQRHEILRLLATLPARQRQVMAWTLDGYGPSEIAEELRITPEAVRSNLMKARRTLAAHIAQAGGDLR